MTLSSRPLDSKAKPLGEQHVMDTRYANTIINVARGEAIPPPYGKVNDFLTEPGGDPNVRYGWKRLKEYFEVAARYNDGHWRIPGYLDGVKLKNKRIPQPGQSGIQWCGIFATWVWIKAGVPGVYWASPGIKGPDVKIIAGFKGIGLGDIGVQTGGLVHHFIISKINDPPDKPGATVETINGNSTYQGITTISRPLSAFSYYYTLDSGFFGVLQKMYGE